MLNIASACGAVFVFGGSGTPIPAWPASSRSVVKVGPDADSLQLVFDVSKVDLWTMTQQIHKMARDLQAAKANMFCLGEAGICLDDHFC